MSGQTKQKEYSNGEVTIVWQADKCFHATLCVQGLPEVFDPKARPWINVENSDTESLIQQVKQCPSGALSFYLNDGSEQTNTEETETLVEVMPNGPLIVSGSIRVVKDGQEEIRNNKTAFCRCGASANKPYCDGQHHKIGFEG
ncbi:MAG: (4Fe-4S)-binding protein [Bacteroidota bacterium]